MRLSLGLLGESASKQQKTSSIEEALKALGYSATAILTFLIMAKVGQKIFEKILDGFVEDRKADLARETERLKASMAVEAEVYRLAAQKRFESLLSLWESSESLFEETDFSRRDSIKAALVKLDKSVKDLNRLAVLMSDDVSLQIRDYLRAVATVLTNSEENFNENAVTADKIGELLKGLAQPVGIISPALSIVAALGGAIVPSVGQALEKYRLKSATEARAKLERALRREFGVWIATERLLASHSTRQAQTEGA